MTLNNKGELRATRKKLAQLEQRIAAIRESGKPDDHATELTIRSLTHLAIQFKEEIARIEARVPA